MNWASPGHEWRVRWHTHHTYSYGDGDSSDTYHCTLCQHGSNPVESKTQEWKADKEEGGNGGCHLPQPLQEQPGENRAADRL
jgi:hypothetical protein